MDTKQQNVKGTSIKGMRTRELKQAIALITADIERLKTEWDAECARPGHVASQRAVDVFWGKLTARQKALDAYHREMARRQERHHGVLQDAAKLNAQEQRPSVHKSRSVDLLAKAFPDLMRRLPAVGRQLKTGNLKDNLHKKETSELRVNLGILEAMVSQLTSLRDVAPAAKKADLRNALYRALAARNLHQRELQRRQDHRRAIINAARWERMQLVQPAETATA